MKHLVTLAVGLMLGIGAYAQEMAQSGKKPAKTMTIYDFKVTDISGKEFSLASLKGKKVMIVNTASECGLTPQYEALQQLYDTYGKENDFTIIGFPSNDFAGQEPGSEKEIMAFCKKNYGVTFPMMSKVKVTGKEIAPLYAFLTQKKLNGLEDSEVQWNFQKYLVDRKGNLVRVISPKTLPDDPAIIEWIKS